MSFPILLPPFLSCLLQSADKLYKGQLSEFTPLASLHTPPRGGGQQQGSMHQRNPPNPRRFEPLTKKLMFTRWRSTPDYCTFTPLLRFSESSRYSSQGHTYGGVGPETAV